MEASSESEEVQSHSEDSIPQEEDRSDESEFNTMEGSSVGETAQEEASYSTLTNDTSYLQDDRPEEVDMEEPEEEEEEEVVCSGEYTMEASQQDKSYHNMEYGGERDEDEGELKMEDSMPTPEDNEDEEAERHAEEEEERRRKEEEEEMIRLEEQRKIKEEEERREREEEERRRLEEKQRRRAEKVMRRNKAATAIQRHWRGKMARKAFAPLWKNRYLSKMKHSENPPLSCVSRGKPVSRGRRPPSRGHHKKVISKEIEECTSSPSEDSTESEEGDSKARVLKTIGGPPVVVGFDPSRVALKKTPARSTTISDPLSFQEELGLGLGGRSATVTSRPAPSPGLPSPGVSGGIAAARSNLKRVAPVESNNNKPATPVSPFPQLRKAVTDLDPERRENKPPPRNPPPVPPKAAQQVPVPPIPSRDNRPVITPDPTSVEEHSTSHQDETRAEPPEPGALQIDQQSTEMKPPDKPMVKPAKPLPPCPAEKEKPISSQPAPAQERTEEAQGPSKKGSHVKAKASTDVPSKDAVLSPDWTKKKRAVGDILTNFFRRRAPKDDLIARGILMESEVDASSSSSSSSSTSMGGSSMQQGGGGGGGSHQNLSSSAPKEGCCSICSAPVKSSMFKKTKACLRCKRTVCKKCISKKKVVIPDYKDKKPHSVCVACMNELAK